jgi:hypothetical protein
MSCLLHMSHTPIPSVPTVQESDVVTVTPRPQSVWRTIAPQLVSLVNISALLTVLGLFTVHSYLATFTHLSTYNISVTQYLAAGMSLFLGLIAFLLVKGLYPLLPLLPYMLIILVGIGIRLVGRNRRLGIKDNSKPFLRHQSRLVETIRSGIRFFERLNQVVVIVSLIGISILFGFAYGYGYYVQVPHMFGGGMPADVILVFKEPQMAVGESATVDGINRRRAGTRPKQ